jgi:hypothetical protein
MKFFSKFHGEGLYVIETIQSSNSFFDNLSDRENYIDKIDPEWISDYTETLPPAQERLNNKGSIRLKKMN